MRGLIGILSLLLIAGLAMATTYHVPGQYSTIQAAINVCSNGDVVLVADGTYMGTGNKNLDFGGRIITLRSESGPANCIIDCQNSGRGFYFHTGESSEARVMGFTVKNGSSTMGGGVNITNSSPTFKNCIIASNVSSNSYGGGIYVSSGNPQFINNTIYGNSAKYGGAMYATSTSMLVNSNIVASNVSSG